VLAGLERFFMSRINRTEMNCRYRIEGEIDEGDKYDSEISHLKD